ncbi:LysE family translocator [Halanaerobium salsuginis]|jgi:threonine/homoserine/homoserine lactone efflux protein|uniref:Threonine/homoserine/homoserine lactone efflux protein n=1 Tax=Halanaerobium salsuginis TaxID=29563 RepID=A0A1I4KAQ0_9FIRM|nr:LysE family transporter [Halanaerobium salsuginis]SFL75760.1 Threonine/homoserine/homoserine lactone efflux protein [Halanaerobium salsuginis]
MLAMFLYGLGIMYSPGPVNLLGINIGLQNRIRQSLGFFSGIAVSLFMYFIVLGFTGERIVKKEYLIYFSFFGSVYIIYLAIKLWRSVPDPDLTSSDKTVGLSFNDAFIMQSLNPKGILATLPIATIHFPASNITGFRIIIFSFLLAGLAFFAPFTYAVLGKFLSKLIKNKLFFNIYNKLMAVLLFWIAFSIIRDHVYLVLVGINQY